MMNEIDELKYKSLQQDKETLLILLDCKEKEIEILKFKLENFESIQRGKCCECESVAIQELSDMHFKTRPFEDDYFNGLTYKDIAELAKKSIRLTAENRRLEDEIEKLRGECEQSEYDYQKQLKNTNKWIAECEDLQKQLQAKEQECEELKQEKEKIKMQYNCYACGTCNGKEDYKNMQRHFEKAIVQNHNYERALDKIENLCKQVSQNNKQAYISTSCILVIINKAKDGE